MSHSGESSPAGANQQQVRRIGRRQFLKLSARALSSLAAASLLPEALAASNQGTAGNPVANTVGIENGQALSQICERILPATDTPGAIAAGVPEFIAEVLDTVYLETEAEHFINQLSAFNATTATEYGAPFDQLTTAQQDNRLSAMMSDEHSSEAEFFVELRQLTVYGYYTSQLGATSEHALTNYMAPWNGDIAYDDVGRLWTG